MPNSVPFAENLVRYIVGLRALEQHGLEYSQLRNLAGVSAGSVVVAMISIGYRADELFDLVQVSKILQRYFRCAPMLYMRFGGIVLRQAFLLAMADA